MFVIYGIHKPPTIVHTEGVRALRGHTTYSPRTRKQKPTRAAWFKER